MNPYFVVATDSSGQRVSFAREATSVDHLRRQLEADGYSDIDFETDDFSAGLRALRPTDLPEPDEDDLRLESKLRRGPARGAIFLLMLRRNAIALGIGALAVAFGSATGRAWVVAGGGALIAFVLVRYFRWQARGDRYDAHLRAFASGDWERAGQLIEVLRKDPALAGIEPMMADLTFRSAALRARRGELPAALAEVAPLRATPSSANGVYESRLSSIHFLAGDIDNCLSYARAAWEASGRALLQQLDLAFLLARLGDVHQAEELLAGIDRRNLTTLQRPVAIAIEGLVAQRCGDATMAVARLKAAYTGFSEFAVNPSAWPIQGALAGHLALALLDAGRRDDARAALAEWRDVAPHWIGPAARRRLETELSA